MDKPRIIVVGSANTDLVVSVPSIPAPGETVLGGELRTVAGGKGANQAVAAARLGADVTFIARVGEDDWGRNAVAGYKAEGIRTEYILATPGVVSGVALVAVAEGRGENAIVVAPGANAHLFPADVEAAAPAFDEAQAVVLSLEVPLQTVLRAAQMAHERSVPVILNPAPAQTLPPELLALTTILTPNEAEYKIVFTPGRENSSHSLNRQLARAGVPALLVTRGAEGVLLQTGERTEHILPFSVEAVDTVGAGDCFTGAVAVELARGKNLAEAARFANAAAALSVTRQGAQPSLPTRAEVEAFLAASNASNSL